MSEAKISNRSARDRNGLAVTCPASRHAEMIAEELIEHGSCGQLADEGKHAGQSILSAVRSLYAARADVARLEAFVREFARCPCCDCERQCYPECDHQKNAPIQHGEMVAAREALYGKEVEDGE